MTNNFRIPKWFVSEHDDNSDTVIKNPSGVIVANLSVDAPSTFSKDKIEAYAKVMAAAPLMVEALLKLRIAIYDGDPQKITDAMLYFGEPALLKADVELKKLG